MQNFKDFSIKRKQASLLLTVYGGFKARYSVSRSKISLKIKYTPIVHIYNDTTLGTQFY